MTAEIRFFWARLNANYWFFPASFAILAALLAILTVYLDRHGFAEFLNAYEWLVPVGPSGASDILTVMAATMIGVASTVFSITLVAVTYASGTYGPRLLTNFLEDKGNQISLATFIAAFVYALMVLRSVRAKNEVASSASDATAAFLPGFTPQLSLLVAYLLVAACVGVLVFFLHHVPSSIRINHVLQMVGNRLIKTVQDTYPNEDDMIEVERTVDGKQLLAEDSGYVQMIDFQDLETIARDVGCTLALRVRTGDFVHRGLPLLEVIGCEPEDIEEKVRGYFTLGAFRTPEQDPQFLIDELVEIGLRALSPGINDPFTAITALHWLGAATCEIARRDLRKDVCRQDAAGCPVVPSPDTFEHYLRRGFGSMRSAVSTSPNAALVMLDVVGDAAAPIGNAKRRHALREQGRLLIEQAREALTGPDMQSVEDRYCEFEARFDAMDEAG